MRYGGVYFSQSLSIFSSAFYDTIMNQELTNLDKIFSRKLREEYQRHALEVKAIWAKYQKRKEKIESKIQNE